MTKLELLGFKSFVSRTVFAFEPGITAIVGPNGSGKSNVADAVRWVLGEQGQSALRARRTEDVIFAGGQGRAQAGLAEATLTFDNAERWLPIDFAEVTVTRRAFRSGENHYLINGKRVRLKDVALLTASLGQSHLVVGQGLVDAALSQRPDERRALFEHAADLAGLRLKVAEAERNLTETESNSERLTDLLTELEPRLRTLERVARQAREWQSVRDRLRTLQQAHFRRLLNVSVARVDAANRELTRCRNALSQARASLDKLMLDNGTQTKAAERARTLLGEHDAERGVVSERLRAMEHERDLAAERATALARRGDDMADTRDGLEARAVTVAGELGQVTAELAAIDQALRAAETNARERDRQVREQRSLRQALDDQLRQLEAGRANAERDLTDRERAVALLEQRAESVGAERERLLAETAGRRDRLERLVSELNDVDAAAISAASTLDRIDQRLTELGATSDQAARRLESATATLAESERLLTHASTRLDAFTRMHQSGAGLHAGVREVLAAAAAGTLTGTLGTVAELVEVPAELDAAIEVALGGHMQDIVVEHWSDAETAIAHLKRSRAGRATFQPLDTVRGGHGRDARLDAALRLPGTRGVAAELVGADDQLRDIVAALLGRTLVVVDLPAARQSLPHLPGGWSAVTLAGEIARSGGSVTGGVAARESGLLARERELRVLPDEIRRLSAARE
ncbi:MAG: AAA family ATPase, partial [Chloroflexota bacterium]|nr:AAA family ATPase [Chloroflexota bacterium]